MKAVLPATITKVTTMADNSIRLQVDTQEIGAEQITEVFQMKGLLGHFFFLDSPVLEIDKEDLPEIKLEKWEKSPSARLRNVFFRYWEQLHESGKTKESFEVWYRESMEKIINSIKEKLT